MSEEVTLIMSKRGFKEAPACPVHSVTVAGKVYTISGFRIDENTAEGLRSGYADHRQQVIKYNENAAQQHVKDTVLHEVVHAMDFNLQMKLSEEQVHALTGAILTLLWDKQNKKFAEWLLKETI